MAIRTRAAFGELLRHYRAVAGLTQEALAERAGLSVYGIQKLERGVTRPYRDTARRLAVALELQSDDLVRFIEAVVPVRRRGSPGLDDAVPSRASGRQREVAVDASDPVLNPSQHAQARGSQAQQTSGLPTGTVTFLLTDVEDSTRLWDTQPQGMRAALIRHDRLLEEIVAQHSGWIVRPRGEGDSRFAVFKMATDAVAAACAIQLAVQHEEWPSARLLRLHMALHSGEADLRDGDYYGTAVNRCARLRSLTHGGQILVSGATYDLVCDAPDGWPPETEVRSLGEHSLLGLTRPERVFQLHYRAESDDHPPLPQLGLPAHNLPFAATSFVGRERELSEIAALLNSTRLLTLTGVGGCGKSRLAIEAGRSLIQKYADGVWLVELAPLTDPQLVLQTIAHSVGVRESTARPLRDALLQHLFSRNVLLILDNFEHLLDAAYEVSGLLAGCAGLRVLATSREALRVRGEQLYPVPGLAMPAANTAVDSATLARLGSVKLFVERAAGHDPNFAIKSENATEIAEICRRVDGQPLAIELAAARINVLSPTSMLDRMARQLSLLIGGSRDLPPRQRTLRDTIAWSYDLLDLEEQQLFCRLGVFVGGCSLETAEGLRSAAEASDALVLDRIASLVDRNVVRRIGGLDSEPRFGMLESIREFALERLEVEGDLNEALRAHAVYYLGWLARPIPRHARAAGPSWTSRLDAEYDNLRAAVRWALDQDELSLLVEAGKALTRYGLTRGYLTELRRWWEEALRRSPHDNTANWPTIAYLLAIVLFLQGENEPIFPLLEESLGRFKELGDRDGMGHALLQLGIAAPLRGDPLAGFPLLREAERLFEGLGQQEDVAWTLLSLGFAFQIRADYDSAEAAYAKALAIVRGLHEPTSIAQALAVEELTGLTLAGLGSVAYLRGDMDRAETRLREGLRAGVQVNDIADCVLHLAGVALARGQPSRAARLLGGAEGMRGAADSGIIPPYRAVHRRLCDDLNRSLDHRSLESARARGQRMSAAEIVAYALETDVGLQLNDSRLRDLTPRELEVARLAACGLSNREIAHNLVITEGTARVHVERVLSKLGLSSRSKLAAWAAESGLFVTANP